MSATEVEFCKLNLFSETLSSISEAMQTGLTSASQAIEVGEQSGNDLDKVEPRS